MSDSGELVPLENERSKTSQERLTEQFYRWECRGRGWQVWNYPVKLEPPFQPFIFHSVPLSGPGIDDARKPTFFSSLADRLKGSFSGNQSGEESYTVEWTPDHFPEEPEAEPETDAQDHELIGWIITLAPDQTVDKEITLRFLTGLTHLTFPVSFEILGSSSEISVHLTCREPDGLHLYQQLRAYFPEAVLSEDPDLNRHWDENDSQETVIVDFGLAHEFMLPVKTVKNFEVDPFISVIAALEGLGDGETGLLQILFQPVRHPWEESMVRAVTDWEGKAFFANAPDMTSLARQKASSPLFAVVIRTAVQSDDKNRAWQIARALGSSLTQFADPLSNGFIALSNDDYPDEIHQEDVPNRLTHRSGMLLNSEELLSLVHFPSPSVRSEKLKRVETRTKAAPKESTGHSLVLGENHHNGKVTTVTLSPGQRIRHIYVIGASGTGKSTLLLNMIIQDIMQGNGIGVLDPHGDLIDQVLGYIPEDRHDDVILFDPSDEEYPIGFNILSAHSELEKNLLASDLVGVFRRFSTSWGDQMSSVLGNAILAFLESDQGGTLSDLRRFLVDESFRRRFLETVKDPHIVFYWQKEYPLLVGRPQASILTRLDTFLRPKLIRHMVSQKENRLDFGGMMNQGKIFLAKLSQGSIGEENAYLLGSLLVSKLHQTAMSRQEMKEADRRHFYLYIDEFQNFVTPSMAAILSGARKYHLGLGLTHQDLKQLWNRDTEIANAVISNPLTRICFRLGDYDAQKLKDGFSFFAAHDLQNLGTGEAICRIERAEHDFNLKTLPLPAVEPELAGKRRERLIFQSRERYATRKEEIQKVIEDNLKPASVVSGPLPAVEKPEKKKGVTGAETASDDQRIFLDFISRNPGMFVTQVYEALQVSGYKGDKLKEQLIEKGLVVQEETRKGRGGRLAKVLRVTDKGIALLKTTPIPGKGGDSHRFLQQTIKEQAESFGWKVKIEEKIPGSLESVDIGLVKGDVRVAVEISVTSKPDYEIQNIRKCLEGGYDYVLCIDSDQEHLAVLRKEAKKVFTASERDQIRFYLPSAVKQFLKGPDSESIDSETAVVSERIPSQKQLLDTTQAAELLGIKKTTLYEWVIQRKIPHVKVGRLTKFRKEAMDAWLNQRSQEEDRKHFWD